MDIAIIGAGVSGLTAAWALRQDHRVTRLRARPAAGRPRQDGRRRDARPGRSPSIPASSSTTSTTYPRFVGLLAELGVDTQPSDMSLGSRCRALRDRVQLAGRRRLLRRLGPVARPSHWQMFADIARFYRDARRTLDAAAPSGATLGDWLAERGYGRTFRAHFLVPITSAVWSTARRPDRRVPGRLPAPLPRQPRPDRHAPIAAVADDPGRFADLRRADRRPAPGRQRPGRLAGRRGPPRRRPAPRSARRTARTAATTRSSWPPMPTTRCGCSSTPTPSSAPRLAASSTRPMGSSSTPTRGSCRRAAPGVGARGTSTLPDCRRPADALTMTYHMNRLQSIPGPVDYCVSVNPGDAASAQSGSSSSASSATRCTRSGRSPRRRRIGELQGHRRTWYAGAHLGYGFHEDGCRSGFEVAELARRRRGGAGGMRSHLLEGTVRHRAARPFDYDLEHGV